MFRKLKGLEGLISLSVAEPFIGENGWIYPEGVDAGPKLGRIHYHHQLYTATDPYYTGKVSVPVLWDRQESRTVNNESADIIRIFNESFDHLTGNALDFYPAALRGEIDRWNAFIYDKVNNGVYRAGFAKSQASYETAVEALFEALDRLEARLGESRYIGGEHLTEADWRLFVTLVRFDAAYYGAFKCNVRRLVDYPHPSNYVRELYQWPGIRETVNLEHIKRGFVSSGVLAADTIEWEGREFEARNVKASVVELKGEQVLRVERDLEALPFDVERLGETVDEPHYMRLKGVEFTDVIFEVKMLARILQPSPFASSQGFIGVYFRATEDDSAFDSIYLRPNAGRADNQRVRNHTVQYFAYPDYKFDKLREMAPGLYETWADVGMDEWITMRVHVKGDTARAFINDAKYPSFIVDDLLSTSKSGSVGLYVDIGTEGYFKDFKIISSSSPKAGGV